MKEFLSASNTKARAYCNTSGVEVEVEVEESKIVLPQYFWVDQVFLCVFGFLSTPLQSLIFLGIPPSPKVSISNDPKPLLALRAKAF